MIESVQFQNFKALRDTTLPLSRFTLIVGPNGSGKSTALQAFHAVADHDRFKFCDIATAGLQSGSVQVALQFGEPYAGKMMGAQWTHNGSNNIYRDIIEQLNLKDSVWETLRSNLLRTRVYSLDAQAISTPVQLNPNMELSQKGDNLAGVLDSLRDRAPERFEAFNKELGRWFPEFDRILFDTPFVGGRAFLLRTREGHHAIRATDLSQGTLLALAILTLGYIPDPPPIVCLEEPDRGIHPRLLRDVQDALYRLSHPESFGEGRAPVQVVATTHSPYLLDLYRDHPEEIVIAEKVGPEARFERLSERPDIDEILQDSHLGDAWYSGVLGGVPYEQ